VARGNVRISYDGFLSNFRPSPIWQYSDVFSQPPPPIWHFQPTTLPYTATIKVLWRLSQFPPPPYDGTLTVWANPPPPPEASYVIWTFLSTFSCELVWKYNKIQHYSKSELPFFNYSLSMSNCWFSFSEKRLWRLMMCSVSLHCNHTAVMDSMCKIVAILAAVELYR